MSKADDHKIQVVFVAPDGSATNGPLISVSLEPPQRFATDMPSPPWDIPTCLSQFRRALERESDMVDCMREMDRLDCWHEAIAQLMRDPKPGSDWGLKLREFWIECGWHIADSLQEDPIFLDALRQLLPPYSGPGMRLYRGELEQRHRNGTYGFAWTANEKVARFLAHRAELLKAGNTLVLSIDAAPEIILAGPTDNRTTQRESEYIVDAHRIEGVSVVGQAPYKTDLHDYPL